MSMAGLDLGTASRFVQSLQRPDFNQQHHQHEPQEDDRQSDPFSTEDGAQQASPGDVISGGAGVGNNSNNIINNNPFPDPSSGLPFFSLPMNVQFPVDGWAGNSGSRSPF
ncbi:uncharacterized protein HKW66_Vig0159780 [Vigna angularis]|uniref:Uncharacterized protein n=1 Tax=Phaseolus angularis TaxID=3914 RepID=A0A8T0JIV7_PHAAN|nr:uncharacterized protein HKW66_Vig0159780 [Vigna angularis]